MVLLSAEIITKIIEIVSAVIGKIDFSDGKNDAFELVACLIFCLIMVGLTIYSTVV